MSGDNKKGIEPIPEAVTFTNSLDTKLNIPFASIPLLPRPCLMEKLNASPRYKLLFVCAPAGYGKTTTVTEWVRKRGRKACWLSLDQMDNQPLFFWRSLSAAIRTLHPDKVEQPEVGVSDVSDAMFLAQTIIREIPSVQTDFFVILDDYQVIEQSFIHKAVSCLLKDTPEFLHMIIISRSELPADFSSFYLQGQVKELRTKDLQFTVHEISALCRKRDVAATKIRLQSLEQVTEGWIAGLHFALMDLGNTNEGAASGDNALADNLYIAAYLESEVWGKFPEEVQEFMAKISVFDTFTAAACEALIQEEDSESMLDILKKSGAFLVALAGDGGWFRYHYLYKAFLRKKLKSIYKCQLTDLHRLAGEWLAQNHFLAQALDHSLQAKDYDKAADLTVEHAKEVLRRGHIHSLLVLFTALPRTVIERNPLVGLAYSWAALLAGSIETYQRQLDTLTTFDFAAKNVPVHVVEKIKNEMLFIRAVAAFKQCDIDESLALNKAAHGRGSFFMNQAIDFNYGEASLLNRNRKLPLPEAIDFALKMNAMWPGISPPDGAWLVFLGELLYERNELDNALSVLREGIDQAERSKIMSIFLIGSITLARIARAKGDLDRAFAIITQTAKKLNQHKDGLRLLEAFRVWLWLDSHDIQKLSAWLASYEISERDSQDQRTEYEAIARIRALQALGRFGESARVLQQCLIRARSEKRVHSLVVLLTLQAIARHGAGDFEGTLFSLNEVLVMARRDGYLRCIIDEGAPVAVLLRQALTSSQARQDAAFADFVNMLLHLINKHVASLKSAISSCPPTTAGGRLTRREQEMLCFLSSGQTNMAIARQTGITINTVKRHIRNLYAKLGVHNRVQAVTQARDMQFW